MKTHKGFKNWESISAGLGVAAGVTNAISSTRPSAGAGAFSGASTGAAIGTSILPGIGTGIGAAGGAILGGIKGALGANEAEEEYQARQRMISRINQNKVSALAQDESFTQGSNNNGFFRFGGQMGITDNSGLTELAQGSFEVKGPSHEQGGVDVGGNNLEGGETISKGYVFSEELGFAQLHKPIAKRIGSLEDKAPSPLRNKTLKSLKEREQELAIAQETIKQQLGIV